VISQAAITHWRNIAPWPQDAQVEQDLILCRGLVEIFQDAALSKTGEAARMVSEKLLSRL